MDRTRAARAAVVLAAPAGAVADKRWAMRPCVARGRSRIPRTTFPLPRAERLQGAEDVAAAGVGAVEVARFIGTSFGQERAVA
jgi:hypothetical protein